MSSSIQFGGKNYLSSKEAGLISGYTNDYVSRLAREEKIDARRVGTQWFVEPKSLDAFLQFAQKAREARKEMLRAERKKERTNFLLPGTPIFAPAVLMPTIASVRPFDFSLHQSVAHQTALSAVLSGVAIAALFVLLPPTISGQNVASLSSALYRLESFANSDALLPHFSLSGIGGVLSQRFFGGLFATTEVPHATSQPVQNDLEGVVVMPSTTPEKTLASVRNSFSDNVEVTLDKGGRSGVIKPVFKEGVGNTYRFVMVPLAHPPD